MTACERQDFEVCMPKEKGLLKNLISSSTDKNKGKPINSTNRRNVRA